MDILIDTSDGVISNSKIFYPESLDFVEAEVDKKTYSSYRYNKNFLMPAEPSAMLFIGPRGCGKTTAMLNMINFMDFDKLAIFSGTIHQPKFQELMKTYQTIAEQYDLELDDIAHFSDDLNEIADGSFISECGEYKKIKQKFHTLCIIDDFAVSDKIKTNAFQQLILNGRPNGISALISTQEFRLIPKPVRTNITHFCFFKGLTPYDVKAIARDYIEDFTPDQFVRLYNDVLTKFSKDGKRPFLTVDKMTDIPEMKYRVWFDHLLKKLVKNGQTVIGGQRPAGA